MNGLSEARGRVTEDLADCGSTGSPVLVLFSPNLIDPIFPGGTCQVFSGDWLFWSADARTVESEKCCDGIV